MDPLAIARTAVTLIADAYAAAQAANDAAAVAALDALLADSAIGKRIVERATAAQAIIDEGRARLVTPVLGVPIAVEPVE